MVTVEVEELSQISSSQQGALAPQIEDWRLKLERTCRHLLPWACSAQMLPLWVSDYGKVCRLAAALNEKIDHLFSLTSKDCSSNSAANASVISAIDQTIDEIALIGRRIERELHDSVQSDDEKPRFRRSSLASTNFASMW